MTDTADSRRVPMPFEEKSAWAVVASTVLVWGAYFSAAVALPAPPDVKPFPLFFFFIGAVVAQVVILVVAHIAFAIRAAPGPTDERDRLIELKADRNGDWVLSVGTMCVALVLIWGGTFNALPFPPWSMPAPYVFGNLLVLLFVLAEIVKRLLQIAYYRRGA
ncbi:MAG: hypothetical protein GEU99_02365 [Luteitalea sp.]|nr:hypothetical protein [Luteitalea sp.]